MAAVSGKAIMGSDPPLTKELEDFGSALAKGDKKEIDEARKALRDAAGNDHAVLDAAAVCGFFASITKIVDFAGHYSSDLMTSLDKMAIVLSGARKIRLFITAPFRWIFSCFSNKSDTNNTTTKNG